MIDLKNVKHPVVLQPEDAIALVDLLQDIKTAAAGIGREETGHEIFDLSRRALQVVDKFEEEK